MRDSNNHEEIAPAASPAELELARLPPPTVDEAKADDKKTQNDSFLVIFDSSYDAENPLDWPKGRKWMVTDVLSATGFNRIMVSTIMAPALTDIASELDMSATEAAMSLSIYLLATAFGPLFIGPLSELYGRQIVLHGSSVWFLAWNFACGFADTKETLIASRFMAGFGASAIYSLAGGVLGDIWRPQERGRSLSVYLLIPLLGAAVGPIIGGFIASRTTWRWMFWSTSIFQAVMMVVSVFSFHETYSPLILRRRAKRFRKNTGNDRYHTESDEQCEGQSAATVIVRALSRPVRLLFFHPIIQIAAILSGFNYGILYITLSTSSDLWKFKYNEPVEISGLHYIACSLGEVIASQIGGYLMDFFYRRHKADTTRSPESRIPLMFPGMVTAWAGLLIYGWTAETKQFWLIVDIGVFVMMFGMQLGGLPMTAYVIDSYGEHTSSALAATQFIKSLTAFLFPLFAPSMYRGLGYGWANSVLALSGTMLAVPLAMFLWKFGSGLRDKAKSTY